MYKFKVSVKVHETSVESRISQRGTPTPERGEKLIVVQFCFRKIHENKSILDQEGSTLPHRPPPPLDPSLHYPGADPGFPVGGGANPRGGGAPTYDFA